MPVLQSSFDTFDKFGRTSLEAIFSPQRLEQAQRWQVNTLESGVLINEGQFRFRFQPLPALAQIAPSMDVKVADLNGDSHLDIVLAQNFYGPHATTGQMDGGLSLLLVGDGQGGFEPLWPNRSGIVVPGDARKVQVVDLNGDAKPDLVFAVQNGTWRAFRNHTEPVQTTAESGGMLSGASP